MQSLVELLQRQRVLKSPRIKETLLKTDRRLFFPPSDAQFPEAAVYADSPWPIGRQATISAPHMHAAVLEVLEPKLVPGASCLDVGYGSGYLVACMAQLVEGPGKGKVVGVEVNREVAEFGRDRLMDAVPHLMDRIQLFVGDAMSPALLDRCGPFDAIHVGASAPSLPVTFLRALKPSGRLVLPIHLRPGEASEDHLPAEYLLDLSGQGAGADGLQLKWPKGERKRRSSEPTSLLLEAQAMFQRDEILYSVDREGEVRFSLCPLTSVRYVPLHGPGRGGPQEIEGL